MIHWHRGTAAVQRLVEFAPASGGLALWLRHQDVQDVAGSTGPSLIGNDGVRLIYGPDFEHLALVEQTGLVAHQVLHLALRHVPRREALRALIGDLDDQLYTICADAIVNSSLSHLTWLRLPAGSVFLEDLVSRVLGTSENCERALLQWDVERLYRAIDDREQLGLRGSPAARQGMARESEAARAAGAGQDAQRLDGPRSAQARALGADVLLDLLPGAGEHRTGREAEEAREWNARITRAHAGDGPRSLLRSLIADLPRTRTPWEWVLRGALTRALARRPELSWSRPSRSYLANQGRAGARRLPWEPGISAMSAVARLVVMVDVSGSIDEPLLQRFAREIEGMTRRLEAGLTLVVGDDQVRRVEHFPPGHSRLSELDFNGGGGTDFDPLLQEADRYAPDLGIFLTDLQGPAHYRPRWPVLWTIPASQSHSQPPFGRLLVLE